LSLDIPEICYRAGKSLGEEDRLKVDLQDHHFTMRELARQDYVRSYPGELVNLVNREMLLRNVET
jgi:hypothetical protein